MNPRLLLIIASDPRTSHRPAEAIRMAAGVGAWKRVDITLYLREAAALVLRGETPDLVDEENVARYLPNVAAFGRPIYVQSGARLLGKPDETPLHFEEIDDAGLAALAANSNCVLRF